MAPAGQAEAESPRELHALAKLVREGELACSPLNATGAPTELRLLGFCRKAGRGGRAAHPSSECSVWDLCVHTEAWGIWRRRPVVSSSNGTSHTPCRDHCLHNSFCSLPDSWESWRAISSTQRGLVPGPLRHFFGNIQWSDAEFGLCGNTCKRSYYYINRLPGERGHKNGLSCLDFGQRARGLLGRGRET